MPWKIVSGHSSCPTSRPFAVVKEGSGKVEGCHETRTKAEAQMRALYAGERGASVDGRSTMSSSNSTETSPATTATVDPATAASDDEKTTDEDKRKTPWPADAKTLPLHSVLVIEGQKTSDNRLIKPNALTWRTLPIPLMWQREHLGRHMGSVVVGRIDEIWRQEDEVWGRGVFDLGSEEGREAARQVAEGFQRGVSIDMEVFEDELVEEGEDMMQVVSSGRVMGLTLVAFPAFPGAAIALADREIPPDTEDGRPLALPVEAAHAHNTTEPFAVTEKPWNGSTSRFTDEQWKMATAGCEEVNTDSPKSDCYLPHHEPDGTVSRRGVHNAAARFNQTRRRNKDKARSHLASHYRRDLKEPVPNILEATSLVASARRLPPPSWFSNPDLRAPTPITVTRDGRIYGHAALWGTCHIARADVCITPPRSRASYAYFLTGETEVAEIDPVVASGNPAKDPALESGGIIKSGESHLVGEHGPEPVINVMSGGQVIKIDGTITDPEALARHVTEALTASSRSPSPASTSDEDCPCVGIPTGPITLGTHHAPLAASAESAKSHYDNSGAAVADVAVGEDAFGIWVSGALRPGISESARAQLRGSSLSGDWRRVGGNLELVALLAVNVPGFPVPRLATSRYNQVQTSLVAAGIPREEPVDEEPNVSPDTSADDLLEELRREKSGEGDNGGNDGGDSGEGNSEGNGGDGAVDGEGNGDNTDPNDTTTPKTND